MIIFLYGQDTYRLKQKLGEIVQHSKEIRRGGLNLRFFDGKNLDYRDFQDEFNQISMFSEKKLLILKNVFQNQEFKDSFLEKGKEFAGSKDNIVFYEEGEISPKDKLHQFLIKNSKAQEFQPLAGAKLRKWAGLEFEKYKIKIQPQVLDMLVNYIGNDLWQFSNEIRKLASFRGGAAVALEDINLLVKPQIETDIFKTIEALALKNKKAAVSLVHRYLDKEGNPLYLLSMIAFQFRNLLLIKETGRLNGHPYFARKTAELARGFSLEDLKKIYRKIFETDLKIKTGQIDPQVALDLLIAEI